MHHVIREGDTGELRALVDMRADLDARDAAGETPLALCAEDNARANLALILLDGGANVSMTTSDDWTALAVAAHSGADVVARMLMDAGVSTEDYATVDGGNGGIAIMVACCSGNLNMIRLLYQAGADFSDRLRGENPTECGY